MTLARIAFWALLTYCGLPGAEAIVNSIWDSISTAISNAFWAVVNFFVDGVVNLFTSMANGIKSLVVDLFLSLAESAHLATSALSERVKSATEDLFSDDPVAKLRGLLLKAIMTRDSLPEEWKHKPFDLRENLRHLDSLLDSIYLWSIVVCVLLFLLIGLLTLGLIIFPDKKGGNMIRLRRERSLERLGEAN